MTRIILAVTLLTVFFIAYVIYSSIKMYRMTKNMDTLTEFILDYTTHPNNVDIIEDYPVTKKRVQNVKSNWTFPNTDGGF